METLLHLEDDDSPGRQNLRLGLAIFGGIVGCVSRASTDFLKFPTIAKMASRIGADY
jgi:hypothetical protein